MTKSTGMLLARRLGMAAILVVVAGCTSLLTEPGPSPAPSAGPTQEVIMPQPTESSSARPTPTARPPAASPAVPRSMKPAMQGIAVADLAGRLGLSTGQVEVVSVEQVEMPVGSLGCGSTEGIQNQGLVLGTEIVLRAGGQDYVYRSDGSKLVPCSPAAFPGGRQPVYASGARPTPLPKPQDAAVADLSLRLGVAVSDVKVVSVESVDWPDASLGCPQPDMAYAQVVTPGYRILLEASGRTYEYHTGQSHAVLCEP